MSASVVPWRREACLAIIGLLAAAAAAHAGSTTATVRVVITAASGRSPAGALAELQSTGDPVFRQSSLIGATRDRALFRDVPPGTYQVTISLAGFSDATLGVGVEPGTIVTLRADLQPAGTESTVTVVAIRPLGDAAVFGDLTLHALPSSRSPWSLIETADARVIVDRIDGGGIWTGQSPRAGVHGSPSTQASLQLGDLDVMDPIRTDGGALIQPDPQAMTAVIVSAGALPVDASGPGPVFSLVPRRPAAAWHGNAHVAIAPDALQGQNARAGIPPVARLESLGDAGAVVSAPLTSNGAGLLTAARFTRTHRVERDDATRLSSDLASVFGHLVVPRPGGEVTVLAAGEWSTHPYAGQARFRDRNVTQDDASFGVQAAWRGTHADAVAWSVSGGYQRATLDPAVSTTAGDDPTTTAGTVERLRDGPVPALFDPLPGTRERWDLRAVAQRDFGFGGRLHALRAGLALGGGSATIRDLPAALVAETVGGVPARVWSYGTVGPESRWSSFDVGGYVADDMALASSVFLDVGVRLDVSRGSARGGSADVSWGNVSPRVSGRWQLHGSERTALIGSYARYAHRLPLEFLAYGDRTGLAGRVYRWNDINGDGLLQPGEQGVLVAAVGPCCAGTVPNVIDQQLHAPRSDEFVVGVEHRFSRDLRVRLVGTDRHDRQLVASVNTGVGPGDYSVKYLPDRGPDWAGPADDRLLPVYDRNPASFGRDRYLLTNPPGLDARYQGLDLTVEQRLGSRGQMLFGAAAYRAEGTGANRGFRAVENDHGVLGEVLENPNAATYSWGRLFFDRAYVIKWSATYLPGRNTTLGVIARYQDGQPFARVVVVPDLQQGAEMIQAYDRGLTRFTFTLTVDAAVEKGFVFGRRRVGVAVQAFNLLNSANEVEEDPITGTTFRQSTALQPPRTIRLGVRLEF